MNPGGRSENGRDFPNDIPCLLHPKSLSPVSCEGRLINMFPSLESAPLSGHGTTRSFRILCSLFLGLILCLGVTGLEAADRKPNVIVIFTDDQGSVDMGAYGAKDLTTPNMDALARDGVRFTQFYSAAPVCSPSRAGLMTGRYPLRAGMPGNAGSSHGQAGVSPEEVMIPEMMKAAGYATAHIGKWHLGYTPETMPNGQGYDHSFGHMGGCIDNYSHFFYWSGPNIHDLHRNGVEVYHDGQYFPELMVKEASQFMEKNREKPFFIYFALNVPHYPYQGHEKWLRHYAHLDLPRRLYAAFLSTVDEYIGQLLAKVDALGLREDTLIIFQSDHGHSTEERAHFGGGSSGPYRGAKFSLFEGGIRVPALVRWPGHIPAGEVRSQLAHGCDWLPTIAELAGVPLPDRPLDGLSLASVIRSSKAPSPHKVVHWQTGRGANAQWAVREGPWKLLGNARDTSTRNAPKAPKLWLSNLDSDLSETRNFAEEKPEMVQRLLQAHESWVEGVEKEQSK